MKYIEKIIAVALSIIIGTIVSVQAFAASTSKKYISEVTVCYASSSEEAKTKLEAKGFKLADSKDLNATLSKGTYLGYKLTDDPKEAITDLAVMNMDGDYSYTDYETMLRKNRENVDSWISNLVATIEEYRSNYEAGIENAIQVYNYLNKITEDVSGLGMGDFLLECDIENHSELTDVFMKGNSGIIAAIEQALVLACDSGTTTWLTRLENSSYDALEERYLTAYKTINKAESAMDIKYGDKAAEIYSVWDDFYGTLQEIGNDIIVENGDIQNETYDETEIAADESGLTEAFTDLESINDIALYNRLASAEYEDGTLLDFFMRPSDEVELYEIYPMCDALSEGQAAQVTMSGLRQLVLSAITDKDSADDSSRQKLDSYIGAIDEISVYDGVDLEIYEKGVALTSDATEHESSSTDHWYNAFLNPEGNSERWAAYVIFYALPTIVMTAVFCSVFYISNQMNSAAIAAFTAAKGFVENNAANTIELIYNNPEAKDTFAKYAVHVMKCIFTQRRGESFALAIAKATCFIFVLIMLVVDIIMLIKTISAEVNDLDYEDIPHHILDATSARGGTDYVMYKAVSTLDGQSADLNGYESSNGWLVLYYTKDTEAGNPILAPFSIRTGSNSTPTNYRNVHLFGSKDAVDITNKAYTGEDDSNGGTFMFMSSSAPALTGSTVTNGIAFAIGIAGLAIGALAGILLGKKTKKQKIREA